MNRSVSALSRNFSRAFAFASVGRVAGSSAHDSLGAFRVFPSNRNIFTTQTRHVSAVSKELGTALQSEIEAEKQLEQENLGGSVVPSIPGFKITTDGAEVRLAKEYGGEKIRVVMNVNHSVDIEEDMGYEDESPNRDQQEPVPVSLPPFSVSITKGDKRLCFELQMLKTEEDGYDFSVEEFYITRAAEGVEDEPVDDQVYMSSGKYIDPKLHDLLFVKYLEERGFTAEFCHQLVVFSTHYEHSQYVNLLAAIRKFVTSA